MVFKHVSRIKTGFHLPPWTGPSALNLFSTAAKLEHYQLKSAKRKKNGYVNSHLPHLPQKNWISLMYIKNFISLFNEIHATACSWHFMFTLNFHRVTRCISCSFLKVKNTFGQIGFSFVPHDPNVELERMTNQLECCRCKPLEYTS